MSSRRPGSKALIADADILIDFLGVNRRIFTLVAGCIGPVYIIRQVLEQVRAIKSEDELAELGLSIVEPNIEDIYSAANTTSRADFEDQLCFFAARRHGFICVTNDTELRKLCRNNGVQCVRGLRLILELARLGAISSERATEIAEQIHTNNPKYIPKELIERFKQALKQVTGDSRDN